jgi:3',5'-cyclic AMP phosphodiesterase CpdA
MLICQLTDLHVRPVGKAANRVCETNMLTERAFRAVARLNPQPDVVVITGDLTDCGLDTEYANLTGMLRTLAPTPVFVIPGNHDQRSNLRDALKHLPGVTADARYVQYAVDDYPVRLVMLDTLVPGAAHGALAPEQLEFLDRTLAAVPDKPTIVGMHHPPFACGMIQDSINLHNAGAFAAVVARHPQVERIICGHHHRAVVARVAHAIALISPSVVHQVAMSFPPHDPDDRGSLILEPPAFQLHRWTPTDGVVSHTIYVEDYPGPFPFLGNPDAPGSW